jgi:hypothetical protein
MQEDAAPCIGLHALTEVCVLLEANVEVWFTTPLEEPLVVEKTLACRGVLCV